MEIIITINTDNDAFAGNFAGVEVARILRYLASQIAYEGPLAFHNGTKLLDANGNTVGKMEVTA